jgi:hypothetical protein
MKKLLLLAMIAMSFLAASPRKAGPVPTCNPCPFVR